MISNMFSGIVEHMVNLGSSAFLGATVQSTFQTFLNFVSGLLYNVAKYMLYFVDLIFCYIQKLCGLDMSYDSLEAMFSSDSDIVFNLLNSGADLVTTIIRNLLVLAIVVIIIFAIIAIIKGQIEALKKDDAGNSGTIMKRTFKAFILLLVTPFITLGGIAASDLILQSLYTATNTTDGFTLGTQIFNLSSSSANAYRVYAQSDQRIPITFDGGDDTIINNYFSLSSEEELENSDYSGFIYYLEQSKLKSSSGLYNALYATYMSFYASDFASFSSMNTILYSSGTTKGDAAAATKEIYEQFYDYYYSDDLENATGLERIESYAEEYYVMADVIDYIISSGSTLYMKTIEEMLTSICELPDGYSKDTILLTIIDKYQIQFYSSYSSDEGLSGEIVLSNSGDGACADFLAGIENEQIKFIYFTSNYKAVVEEGGEPEVRMQIPVIHVVGQTDELLGAKYIMVSETNAYNSSGTPDTYFEPLINNYTNTSTNSTFDSDYISDGQIIVAKGIFKDSIYPTAIKQDGDTKTIVFYREDIETQATGQMSNFASLTVETTSGGFFSKIIKFVQSLFDPSSLIPVIDVDFDAITLTYDRSAEPTEADTLVDGKLRLGYFMQYSPQYVTTSLANNLCLSFKGLFVSTKMNYMILIVCSVLLLRVSMSAISSLIERSYELFLLFLTYPAACATIPIDDGGAYNTWLKGYFVRIFRTYGFILGINFVLMLFPIIQKIEFFTQDEVGTSTIIHRVGILFFSAMSIRQITSMLNSIVVILFELTAFTLIETIPDVISGIVAGQESALRIKDNNVFTKIKNTTVKAAKTVAKIAMPPLKTLEYVFSNKNHKKAMRQKAKNQVLNKVGLGAFSDMSQWKPGSAITQERQYKANLKAAQEKQKKAQDDLMKVLDDPSKTKADAMKALVEFEGASQQANKAGRQNDTLTCKDCGRQFKRNEMWDHYVLKEDDENKKEDENEEDESKNGENGEKKKDKLEKYVCSVNKNPPRTKWQIENLYKQQDSSGGSGGGSSSGGSSGGGSTSGGGSGGGGNAK